MVGHSTLSSCVLSRWRAVLAMDVIKAAASGLAMPLTRVHQHMGAQTDRDRTHLLNKDPSHLPPARP